jgi:hypothetical protein
MELALPAGRDRTLEMPLTPADVDDTIGQSPPMILEQELNGEFHPREMSMKLIEHYPGSFKENDMQDTEVIIDNAKNTVPAMSHYMHPGEPARPTPSATTPALTRLPLLSCSAETPADELQKRVESNGDIGKVKAVVDDAVVTEKPQTILPVETVPVDPNAPSAKLSMDGAERLGENSGTADIDEEFGLVDANDGNLLGPVLGQKRSAQPWPDSD